MSRKLTEYQDEKIIEFVRCHPELYYQQHKDFKKLHKKDDLWSEISEEIGKEIETCKKRWKDIRDNYFKILRKQKAGTGPPLSKIKWWPFEKLSFLSTDDNKEELLYANIKLEEDTLEYADTSSMCPSESPKSEKHSESMGMPSLEFDIIENVHAPRDKRSSNQIETSDESGKRKMEVSETTLSSNSKRKKGEDDVDLFMRSIALSVKKFPARLITEAKIKILSIVAELEEQAAQSCI